jgi:ferredoxin-NADP reductase
MSEQSLDRVPVRLQSVRYAARDTHLYEFVRLDGQPFPSCTPGAHIDVHLPNGITRAYSLVESGEQRRSLVVGVKRDPNSRGGSRWLHEQARVGMELHVSGPRNHFPLLEDASHTVLVAGGIGITPIWCMAQRLKALGKPFTLYYSARSRADMAFLEEAQALGDAAHLHFDDEAGGVMDMAAIMKAVPVGAHLYCCGPTPMLDAYEAAAKAAGLPADNVHLERFTPVQAAATDGNYVVQLARSGKEIQVTAGTTLLEALEANGICVGASCREGLCGTCEVVVLEGEVDHRDSVLTDAEKASNRTMMVCCSGSRSARLVLDL